jgi:hypothetical protein
MSLRPRGENSVSALYIAAIILVAALLFAAVERLEPNYRLAIVFKCAILAAGGAAIASNCCLEGIAEVKKPYLSEFCEEPLGRAG